MCVCASVYICVYIYISSRCCSRSGSQRYQCGIWLHWVKDGCCQMEREKCRAHLFTMSNLPAGRWRWSEGAMVRWERKRRKLVQVKERRPERESVYREQNYRKRKENSGSNENIATKVNKSLAKTNTLLVWFFINL